MHAVNSYRFSSRDEQQEVIDLLTRYGFMEHPAPQGSPLKCYCPHVRTVATLRRLKPLFCPRHQETTLESRLSRAHLCLSTTGTDFFPILQEYINPEWSTDPELVCNLDTDVTLLHILALGLGETTRNKSERQFLTEAIRRTKNLHPCNAVIHTPLGSVFQNASRHILSVPSFRRRCDVCISRRKRGSFENCLETAVSFWLHILEDAGVDINQYGQRELHLFQNNRQWEWSSQEYLPLTILWATIWPISFEIVSANNFHFYWQEGTDKYAGEFWRFVDEPGLNIPGSWVD